MDGDAFGPGAAADEMRQACPVDEATVRQAIDRRKSDIRAHEAFTPIMQAAAKGIVAQYEQHWMINRILNDRGRFLIAFAILHLHFEGIRSGAADTLTSTTLKTLCAGQSICSPGRATALLATMRLAGLVRTVRTSDGRRRALAPTPEFIALHRARLKRVFAIAGPLMTPAQAERSARGLESDLFVCAIVSAFMEVFLSGFRVFPAGAQLESLSDRDGGMLIICTLIQLPQGSASTALSVSELARRFCLSRSHVASILREAEEKNLLSRDLTANVIQPLPKLYEAAADFFATIFALHNICTTRALDMTAAIEARSSLI